MVGDHHGELLPLFGLARLQVAIDLLFQAVLVKAAGRDDHAKISAMQCFCSSQMMKQAFTPASWPEKSFSFVIFL